MKRTCRSSNEDRVIRWSHPPQRILTVAALVISAIGFLIAGPLETSPVGAAAPSWRASSGLPAGIKRSTGSPVRPVQNVLPSDWVAAIRPPS